MVKFDQLDLDQLKRELIRFNLPTSGGKVELQRRLMDEFDRQGLKIESYEFECEEEQNASDRSMGGGMDLCAMFAAMMEEKLKEMETRLLETAKRNRDEIREIYRDRSERILDKMNEIYRDRNERILNGLNEILRVHNEKMQTSNVQETSRFGEDEQSEIVREEISESTGRKVSEVSEAIDSRVDGAENEKQAGVVEELDDNEKKLGEFEASVSNLQHHERPVVQEASSEIKSPSFDSGVSTGVSKFRFETMAEKNLRSIDQKAVEGIFALKGVATKVLEGVPLSSKKSVDGMMASLKHDYGEKCKNFTTGFKCLVQCLNLLKPYHLYWYKRLRKTWLGRRYTRFKVPALLHKSRFRDPALITRRLTIGYYA